MSSVFIYIVSNCEDEKKCTNFTGSLLMYIFFILCSYYLGMTVLCDLHDVIWYNRDDPS